MSYHTSYTLAVLNDGLAASAAVGEAAIAALLASNEDAAYALGADGNGGEDCSWYRHEEQLRAFSREYPKLTFELAGCGEEFPDVWKKYFRDGKTQTVRAVISFPPFDPKKLK